MQLLQMFRERASIRAFIPKPVEHEKVSRILEAGRLAPSACNRQPWTFLVIDEPEAKQLLCRCYPKPWFETAMLYIVVIGHKAEAWSRPSGDSVDIDTSIATTQIMLQCHEEGLGSTWVCAFDQELCAELFRLPENQTPVSILAIGYPDGAYPDPSTKKRKAIDEVVKYNHL